MTFTQWTNDHVLFLFSLLFLTLTTGLAIGTKRGGWNRHLPYFFTLIISTQYYLISPLYFYLNDRSIIIGTNISQYYGLGVFFPLIGLICFITGYWAKASRLKIRRVLLNARQSTGKTRRQIAILFCIIYCVVIVNMAIGGIDVKNIFLGDTTLGLGARGETYFLQNFADSLISLIILGYIYVNKRSSFITALILSFFLFSLLGFRYRILLTLFGLAFSYLYFHRLKVRTVIFSFVTLLVFFYFIMLITENRGALIRKDYSALEFNPGKFDYSNYFEQTRGSLADMTVYKLYDNPNKQVSHDYGASMFLYIFVRMIPRALYENKDDFYPPPQNRVQNMAFDAWWGKVSGEAILSCASFYIAFGWFGVVFFHFIWGFFLRKLEQKIDFSDTTQIAIYIVVALVTFQWITRAYLPQAVDHAVYLLIPVLIVRYLTRSKKWDNPSNILRIRADIRSKVNNT